MQIIKDGGYANSTTYVSKLCSIIERWKLTQYDTAEAPAAVKWYRVRKNWSDAASQKGAYKVLANAKKCADANPGYSVFDDAGKVVYTGTAAVKTPFLVRVDISDLNIRTGAGTNYSRTGQYTGKGIFTILEVKSGQGWLDLPRLYNTHLICCRLWALCLQAAFFIFLRQSAHLTSSGK